MKTNVIPLPSNQHKPIVMNSRRALVLPVDAYPVGSMLELRSGGGRVFRVVTDIDTLESDVTKAVYSLRPLSGAEKFERAQESEK
jgi:hypothetical protein